MKPFARVVCLSFWVAAMLGSAVRADLSSDVDTILADKLLRKATVGIEVIRLGKTAADSKSIFELNSTTPLTPASNLKLATTSAALDRLGPEFKFRTVLLVHDGDAILIGDGDPTFGDLEYLKKAGWTITTVYENWAAQLKKLGIDRVGSIIIDDSVFDEHFTNPRWPEGQYTARFEAGVGGINLNTNVIECLVQPSAQGQTVRYLLDPPTQYVTVQNTCVTSGRDRIIISRPVDSNAFTISGEAGTRGNSPLALTVVDPPLYAGTVLAETLQANGVKVTGGIKRDRTARIAFERASAAGGKWTIVGIHETPLQPVLARANKDSVNLYAESLCKRLGFDQTHASGSWENGTAAVGAFLQKASVATTEFHLDDGSGLSRDNRISPHALARVLVYDHFSKNNDMFFNSLAVAGVDGTFDTRFAAAEMRDLRRRVYGKSGFIEGVSTISGYLHAKDDQWYAFSIMINGIPHQSNSEIKLLQEKVIRAVDNRTRGE
ncbi:MAG TPA: D-alanyl-D-alanine carboxypeptidase/D-alanyl-D-alanine-endopeptidase [Humisphaera sp.]|jgi:D-alanyl-D-alanine carboxypeptidase/D-alanyl-D-alanine-endopeptidase (penicillin-binding protein 4)|nr:D-alanyl-D-alanine carboxypeptidase/D-alanyl-D-alanine-endopeptidase [Humisphaera sp.]